MSSVEGFLGKVHNEDCVHGMGEAMPASCVDMIVTSPPYNTGIDYGGCYDDNKSLEEYLSFMEKVAKGMYRVLKDGGRAAINVANTGRKPYVPLSSYMNMIMLDCGFNHRGEIIWDKGASVGSSCAWGSWKSPSNPSLRDVHEYILVFSKGEYSHEGEGEPTLEADEFAELTKSIWRIQTGSAAKSGHPAPFPIEIPERLIRLYTYTGDIVLDPFIGSGTTAIACIKNGRRFIGFELNGEYCDLANGWIKSEANQVKLF